RHTRSTRDWSSDVCSSDLGSPEAAPNFLQGVGNGPLLRFNGAGGVASRRPDPVAIEVIVSARLARVVEAGPVKIDEVLRVGGRRSEERRVGKGVGEQRARQ